MGPLVSKFSVPSHVDKKEIVEMIMTVPCKTPTTGHMCLLALLRKKKPTGHMNYHISLLVSIVKIKFLCHIIN
jgi:hypothetical protein